MNQVMALYRPVFGTDNHWTMLVDGTARAGIEAALVSLIAPGERAGGQFRALRPALAGNPDPHRRQL
jgi:hypothetical protein